MAPAIFLPSLPQWYLSLKCGGDQLKMHSAKEKPRAGYWKSSQLLNATEVSHLGREPATITLLNQHNPYQESKHLSLNPQISIVLFSH